MREIALRLAVFAAIAVLLASALMILKDSGNGSKAAPLTEQHAVRDRARGAKVAAPREVQRKMAQIKRGAAKQQTGFPPQKDIGFLTTLARDQVRNGNPVSGVLLALEALSEAKRTKKVEKSGTHRARAIANIEAGLRASREIALLSGHVGAVYSVAISPDGAWIVTGSEDKTARIWNTKTGKTLSLLRNHEGTVYSVAVSPDGTRIVTGSWDISARIWDAKTGKELALLKGHEGNILSVAISPDGSRVVTGSGDNTARIWHAKTGEPLVVLKGHDDNVWSVAMSPDGSRLVTGSGDNTARIWDTGTGKQLMVLKGHEGAVYSVAVSPDGSRIVTGSWDNTARIWDASNGKLLTVLKGHEDNVWSVGVSPDGASIVTGSGDNTARIWDAKTGKLLDILKGHEGTIYSVAVSPDGKRIITGSNDNTARIWRAKTKKSFALLEGHEDNIYAVAVTADGARIATGSDDKTARIWDARTGEELAVLAGHEGEVISIAASPDSERIITGSRDGTARIWNAKTGDSLAVLTGHEDAVTSIAISPNGTWVVTGSDDTTARIWNARSGELVSVLKGHQGAISSILISPGGTRIITGSMDGTARIWNPRTGSEIAILRSGPVYNIAVSPDGHRIVTGSWNQTARIWDTRTGNKLAVLRGHTGAIFSLAVSPDGSWIVTGSGDNTARIWDARTGASRGVLKGHTGAVHSVAVSPDGVRIVTGSWDNTARIWHAKTGEQLAVLEGHTAAIYSVAMSPDGTRIVTSSIDNTARIWRNFPPPTDGLVNYAKTSVRRCLTPDERKTFQLSLDPPRWCLAMGKWPYDGLSIYLHAKSHLLAGREDAAKTAFARALSQDGTLRQRINRALGTYLNAVGDRHFVAKENRKALESYTRFLSMAEGVSSLNDLIGSATLRRGIVHYRLNSYAQAVSDLRHAANLAQKKAGHWLWTAINGPADKLYREENITAALLQILANYRGLSDEDRLHIKAVDLKASLWRLSYALSQLYIESSVLAAPRRVLNVNQCDHLAAHSNDPLRVTHGVRFEKISIKATISACSKLIKTSPNEPRLYLQRARAYARAREHDKERADLEVAMNKGYPMAFNNMGYAYLNGEGVDKSPRKGANLYLETFNRVIHCCGAQVAKHLLSLRDPKMRNADKLRRTARMILDWGAALGDPQAHEVLGELYEAGELKASGIGVNARSAAYFHFRSAQKLWLSMSVSNNVTRAAVKAQTLTSFLSHKQMKAIDDRVSRRTRTQFTAAPAWVSR